MLYLVTVVEALLFLPCRPPSSALKPWLLSEGSSLVLVGLGTVWTLVSCPQEHQPSWNYFGLVESGVESMQPDTTGREAPLLQKQELGTASCLGLQAPLPKDDAPCSAKRQDFQPNSFKRPSYQLLMTTFINPASWQEGSLISALLLLLWPFSLQLLRLFLSPTSSLVKLQNLKPLLPSSKHCLHNSSIITASWLAIPLFWRSGVTWLYAISLLT